MTCKDCIHEDLCMDKFKKQYSMYANKDITIDDCEHFKNKADFEKVKHGKWKKETKFIITDNPDDDGYWRTIYICSECEREEWRKEPYCHCGAKMDRKTNINNTRCNKCINETHCSKHRIDCPDYKRDATDGGYYR